MKPDQTRVGALLIDTVSLLCRNGLNFNADIKVQGLLGITIDGTDVFLVHFNETFTENQPTASAAEAQSAMSDAACDMAAVEVRAGDSNCQQNQTASKPTFRRTTGFPPSVGGPRHRYGALPLSVQARRRARQMGTSMNQRMKANSKSVEGGDAECTERPPSAAESDEKPDCSALKNIKTESDVEQLVQDVPEEQDDVIFVESEDGALDHDGVLPSDLDSGRAYLKTEDRSEYSGDAMYPYNDSYEQFDPSSSELVHGGLPGTFSSYGSNSGDVKPMNQMLPCTESWSGPQLDWNCTQSGQTVASKYGQRMPVGPPPSHVLNHEDIEHMDARSCQLPVVRQRTTDQRASLAQRYYGRRNASSEVSFTKHMDPRFCTLPPNRQMSAQLTPSAAAAAARQTSSVASYAKLSHTVTKYVCNLCDATFNHHCTLLTHQVRKHGRKKNARRGRPAQQLLYPSDACVD